MDLPTMHLAGLDVPVASVNTVVVGTGSAGYCAADRLAQFGQHDVLVIADTINAGASRNAGSDKQTYYKLTWPETDRTRWERWPASSSTGERWTATSP